MPLHHSAQLQLHFYLGLHLHDGYLVPENVSAKLPHFAADTLQGVFLQHKPSVDLLGLLRGDPKIETSLGPLGIPFEGRCSDSGFVVPHIYPLMNDVMVPLTILFGGSITLLGSSGVQVATCDLMASLLPDDLPEWLRGLLGDSGPTDMAANIFPWSPLSLNLACSDPIPLPTDIVIAPNNVMVGITLRDFLAALVSLVIEVALAALIAFLGEVPGLIKKNWGKQAVKEGADLAGAGAGKGASKLTTEGVEAGADGASGAAARNVSDAIPEPPAHVLEAGEMARIRRRTPAHVLEAGEMARIRRRTPAHVLRTGRVAQMRRAGQSSTRRLLGTIAKKYLKGIAGGVPALFGSTIDEVGGGVVNLAIGLAQGKPEWNTDDALSDHLGGLVPADADLGHPRPTFRAPDLEEVDGQLHAQSAFTVELEFDHAVKGFSRSDLVTTNATIDAWRDMGDRKRFVFTLLPRRSGKASVSIATASCFREQPLELSDLERVLSNPSIPRRYPNLPGRLDVHCTIERPTVTLTASGGVGSATHETRIRYSASFSEDVSRFAAGDVEVTFGDVLDFTAESASDYAFEVDVGESRGELTVRVPEDVAQSALQRGNLASNGCTTVIDTEPPAVEVTGPGHATGVSPVTFQVRFSERVRRFQRSQAVARCDGRPAAIPRCQQTGESNYEVDVQARQPGVVELVIPAGAVEDLAGNPNDREASDAVDYDPRNATDPASPDLAHLPPQDREAIGLGAEIMGLRAAGGTA